MGDRLESHWILCLAFPTSVKGRSEEELAIDREDIIGSLLTAGLRTTLFYSTSKTTIFCKVGASDNRLLKQADISELKLRVDSHALKKVAETREAHRAPIYLDYPYKNEIDSDEEFLYKDFGKWKELSQESAGAFIKKQSGMNPFQDIHVRYSINWETRIFNDHKVSIYHSYNDGSILRSADRIKLLMDIIQGATTENATFKVRGAGLDIKSNIFEKKIEAAFPLQLGTTSHLRREMTSDLLFKKWETDRRPWRQPLNDIRDFCGEKIALYFAFLGHYTLWLTVPALLGTIIFIHQMINMKNATGSFNVVGPGASAIIVTDTNGTLSFHTELYTKVDESPFFALFISFWSTLLIEFWKRKQNRLALKWGMSDFESREDTRVQFKPTHKIPSAVTGKSEVYYSQKSFLAKAMVSLNVLFFFVVVVVAAIGAILVLKVYMSADKFDLGIIPPSIAPQIALVINSIAIIVLGNVYKNVARQLNDWENHRTEIQYEDHLIAKTFVFSFINSYATLTYMAFIRKGMDILGVTQYCIADAELIAANLTTDASKELLIANDRCYGSLSYSLFIIFASQIIVNNTLEIGIPFLSQAFKRMMDVRAHAKAVSNGAKGLAHEAQVGVEAVGNAVGFSKNPDEDVEEKQDLEVAVETLALRRRMMSPCERQLLLKEYETPFDDYLEIALQFGYVTLFVAAFPIAPLLALLNNLLEVKVDSYKVCKLSRRPFVPEAQDIGTWETIFKVMGIIAVLSNASVILFTSTYFDDSITPANRVWLWVIFVGFVLTMKVFVDFLIPDVPGEVKIQLERQDYFHRKIFLQEPDDEVDDMEAKRKSREYTFRNVIEPVDPFIKDLLIKTADVLKETKEFDADVIFARVDRDGDGEVTTKEMEKALRSDKEGLGAFLSSEEVHLIVQGCDVDGDGVISKDEFKRYLNL